MSRRSLSGLVMAALILGAFVDSPRVWAQKPKEPKWTHAFDLMVRKYKEAEFDEKKTQKFGVEVFKDTNTNYGLYISQAGSFGAAPGFDGIQGAVMNSKGAKWTSGLDLPARKAGEKEFTEKTQVWSMEVFHDANAGNWLYVTETAKVAVVPGPVPAGAGLKAPKWVHSVDLRCRKGGTSDWKGAAAYGIEVYRDANTNNLIYISDPGYIAVIPENPDVKTPAEGKAPDWLHGLDLSCRHAKENDFTKDTKKWGIEVFRDENNGNLVYICENGAIAVVSGAKGLVAPTKDVKQPVWTHGLNLAARKAGEKEFTEATKVYGAEIFRDDNTNVTLYINETGVIAVVPTKK